jgi:shikimate dehydrogenase
MMRDNFTRPNSLQSRVRVGLIGSGIQASGSPAMHMAEALHHNLQYCYELLDLDNVAGGPAALRDVLLKAEADGFAGVNITHPCKQRVIDFLHEVSDDVRALGAVNTVVFSQKRRIGHNTDWFGFTEGFKLALPGARIETVTQLGAGGAGSAVAYALLKMGTNVLNILDTDPNKALQLTKMLSATFADRQLRAITSLSEALVYSDGLVNASPIGMRSHPGLPLPAVLLRPSLWVAEVVYFPLETELLKLARSLGCRTADGGGMAVFQAVEAFRLFTGIAPDSSRMLQWFRQNIRK